MHSLESALMFILVHSSVCGRYSHHLASLHRIELAWRSGLSLEDEVYFNFATRYSFDIGDCHTTKILAFVTSCICTCPRGLVTGPLSRPLARRLMRYTDSSLPVVELLALTINSLLNSVSLNLSDICKSKFWQHGPSSFTNSDMIWACFEDSQASIDVGSRCHGKKQQTWWLYQLKRVLQADQR